MRTIPLMTALTASLLMAGAVRAATPVAAPVGPPAPPAAVEPPLPPIAEDQAQADAMTAQLAAFDARISADEQRITVLRDAALAQENARIRAIKPALPYGGHGLLPGLL